ncbi:MAG: hypothetical protein KDK02_01820 [Rhodobacteraceae bacterium]|nr:hypothetical protein [Paracoccaceae bacterium]
MHDFFSDRSITRMLEIECQYTDEYLIGHARRVGLAGEQTNAETLERLLPTIRNDLMHEADRIRDADFARYGRIHEVAAPQENAVKLAEFLSIGEDKALDLAVTEHLFAD